MNGINDTPDVHATHLNVAAKVLLWGEDISKDITAMLCTTDQEGKEETMHPKVNNVNEFPEHTEIVRPIIIRLIDIWNIKRRPNLKPKIFLYLGTYLFNLSKFLI